MNIEQALLNILDKLPAHRNLVIKNEQAWIRCPFHNKGQENTPSCRINIKNKPYGYFFCHACSEKGPLNKILAVYNLRKFDPENFDDDPSFRIKSEIESSIMGEDSEFTIDNPMEIVPWSVKEKWRGISGQLIHDIGGQLFLDKSAKFKLLLPVVVFNKTVGAIECLLKKEQGVLSYENTPGKWTKDNLFLYDYIYDNFNDKDYVFLCEGPRDSLNFVQNNIPALSILGTGNWSQKKLDSLVLLDKKSIFIAFDGDNPGRTAAGKIYQHIKKSYPSLNVKKINFPEGKDPADLTKPIIKTLKNMLGI